MPGKMENCESLNGQNYSNINNNKQQPEMEIVISGFSGRYPESSNVAEFRENLYNGINMVNDDERRWPKGFHGLPPRSGKLKDKDLESFDYQFFGVHQKLAVCMDPQLRMLLEITYEALIDAGINPQDIRGTRTGVYVGVCNTDIEHGWCNSADNSNGYEFLGGLRSMLANRISYAFNWTGPSFAIDSACSSSLHAVAQAFHDIKTGRCDMAVACGANLALHPLISERLLKLGVLSPTGSCQSFDARSNGYCRSEACGALVIQKSVDSKRIYAKILNANISNDGYKQNGITFPNGVTQRNLLEETCKQIGLDPLNISYVEAHGPGTVLGDTQEMSAVTEFMCKGRQEPLLIGSVKSNMGHGEAAAGVCSVTKVLLAMESGIIPGNLHFITPNPHIAGLTNGQLKVVDANLPWSGGIASINSFGLGGANANVLLESVSRRKTTQAPESIPRLITVSGRTSEAVEELLKNAEFHQNDAEYFGLLNEIFAKNIPLHHFRGYAVFEANQKQHEVVRFAGEKRQIWFIYSGMGSQWGSMANEMLQIDVFRESLQQSAAILKTKGIDLMDILTNSADNRFDDVMNSFVAITAMQIALTDVLNHIGIQPDGIVGQSMGEIVAGYADKCLTLKQSILGTYFRGKSVTETDLIPGVMASVGLTWQECSQRCPKNVFPVIHNTANNVTISGPSQLVEDFVAELTNEGIFAKLISVGGYAFHTKFIAKTVPKLLKWLKETIPRPKKRSKKWISSSIRESERNGPLSETCSAEYYVNNWISPVLFYQAMGRIPRNAICIEIAPHGLLQGMLRQSMGQDIVNISLMQKHNRNNLMFFLRNIGILYENGVQPDIAKLYRPIQFPVSRATPMLNSHIKWDHSQQFKVPKLGRTSSSDHFKIEVNLSNDQYSYVNGHKVFGQILFPATGYLTLVWEQFSKMSQTLSPIIFENIKFHRATILQPGISVKFQLKLLTKSNQFELCENDALIVSGKIFSSAAKFSNIDSKFENPNELWLDRDDVYRELRTRGYDYKNVFVGISGCDPNLNCGQIEWKNNWTCFMDAMLQFCLLSTATRDLYLPSEIRKIVIDPIRHDEIVSSGMEIPFSRQGFTIKCGGIEMQNPEFVLTPKRLKDSPTIEKYTFIPYNGIDLKEMPDEDTAVDLSVRLVAENCLGSTKITVLDIVEMENGNIGPKIKIILNAEPLLISDLTVLTSDAPEQFKESINDESVKVISNRKEIRDARFNLIVGYNILQSENPVSMFEKYKELLFRNGFMFLQESWSNWNFENFSKLVNEQNFKLVSVYRFELKMFILLRHQESFADTIDGHIVRLTGMNFDWLNDLKEAMKQARENQSRIYLCCQGEPDFGAMGLMNCLKNEQGGQNVRLIFIQDQNRNQFNLTDRFYADQLDKDLIVNVFKDGEWGSFRHLPINSSLDKGGRKKAENSSLCMLTPGSLSFVETQGPKENTETCKVFYGALNRNDVEKTQTKMMQKGFGIEFSGRNAKGERIMALTPSNGLSTECNVLPYLMWPIPKTWTLAEGATLPVAYSIAYYSLFVKGNIRPQQTILIVGAGTSIGLAVASVSTRNNIQTFAIVDTAKQSSILTDYCLQLKHENVLFSLMKLPPETEFDLILNCESNTNLSPLAGFLKPSGFLIQIGPFHRESLTSLSNNVSVHFVNYHQMLNSKNDQDLKTIHQYLTNGIRDGYVRPLPAQIFNSTELTEAFQLAESAGNLNKILIQIRPEDSPNERPLAVPRINMFAAKSYIIIGGLGGFGIELCYWLVARGARKLIIISRSGIDTNYKAFAVKRLENQGTKVVLMKSNVSNSEQVQTIFEESRKFGPIGGIFNLAATIRDNLIQDQTENDYQTVAESKIQGTRILDIESRLMCPDLDWFVCFSSVSCGRGTGGQTNYGLANSAMERICDRRQSEGYPAIAIQWGSIADTGLYYNFHQDNAKTFIGTKPQRIASCIQMLDILLRQPNASVVSSFVLAEKISITAATSLSVSETVAQIIGIKDLKNVPMNLTLTELGVDSLMVTEIRQTLKCVFDLNIDAADIRQFTFEKLKTILDTSK